MSLDRRTRAGLLSGATALFLGTTAFAQEPAAPAAAAPAEPAPAPAAAEPAPAPAPAAEAPAPAAESPTAEALAEKGDAPKEEEAPTGLSWMLFADAYASVNTAQDGAAGPWHQAYSGMVYDNAAFVPRNQNGFGLSWLGLDTAYNHKYFGVTGSLRFGSAVPAYFAGYAGPLGAGIANITQAYVTLKPMDGLSIDFGQFYTIFGAEVAESWKNLNYTRGGLYYGFQPFWHTGARVTYQTESGFVVKGMLVNPVNSISNLAGSLNGALQVGYTSTDFTALIGGNVAFEDQKNPGLFDRFVDLVVTANVGDLSVVANADVGISTASTGVNGVAGAVFGPQPEDAVFWGASLAARYAIVDQFGIAARGELLNDTKGLFYSAVWGTDTKVVTGTFTLDYKPNPNVVLRWDNRVESSLNQQIYFDGGGGPTSGWFTSVLGAVVHTEGLLK